MIKRQWLFTIITDIVIRGKKEDKIQNGAGHRHVEQIFRPLGLKGFVALQPIHWNVEGREPELIEALRP